MVGWRTRTMKLFLSPGRSRREKVMSTTTTNRSDEDSKLDRVDVDLVLR